MRRPRGYVRVRQPRKKLSNGTETAESETDSSPATTVVCNGESTVNGCAEKKSNGIEPTTGWVKLNVGGVVFQTSRMTLCRAEGSFLARLVQEDHELPSEKDENGAYLIDRDPQYFSPILNYLRHGKLVVNHGLSEEGVLEEADFYNIPELSQLCAERIQERNSKAQSKHVYRVIQCHGEELTSVVSAMSEDWRLQQLIPIGIPTYSADGQNEYLCVVSRECSDVKQPGAESQDRAKLLQQRARHN